MVVLQYSIRGPLQAAPSQNRTTTDTAKLVTRFLARSYPRGIHPRSSSNHFQTALEPLSSATDPFDLSRHSLNFSNVLPLNLYAPPSCVPSHKTP